jgi:hypothetical protein
MAKRVFIRLVAAWLLAGLLFGLPSVVMATGVDHLLLCDLEGHPGETIEAQITLQGTDAQERSGYWYTYYNRVDGDDEKMDITSWITIEPEEYAIKLGESLVFTVNVKIPADAAPGVWGATNEEACQTGHSADRRSYIIFKDAVSGGNVYSGMAIPVLVTVLGEGNPPLEETSPPALEETGPPLEETGPLAPPEQSGSSSSALDFIKDNIIAVVLGVIVIILLAVLLTRRRARG